MPRTSSISLLLYFVGSKSIDPVKFMHFHDKNLKENVFNHNNCKAHQLRCFSSLFVVKKPEFPIKSQKGIYLDSEETCKVGH